MNKSKKYNKLGNKVKNNQTKRRRKIGGGGYEAELVVIPVYDLDDDGEPIITKLKQRFFPKYNLKLGQRMGYMDDLIRLTIDDETLVPKGVIPVVHHLKGRRSTNKTAANVPVVDRPVTNVPVTDRPATNVPATNRPATDRTEMDVPATSAPEVKTGDIKYTEDAIKKKLSELYPNESALGKLKEEFKMFDKIVKKQRINTAIAALLLELQKSENEKVLKEFMEKS